MSSHSMPKRKGIAWSTKKHPSNWTMMTAVAMNSDGGNRKTRRKSRIRKRR